LRRSAKSQLRTGWQHVLSSDPRPR
jgi:hypothetical protein